MDHHILEDIQRNEKHATNFSLEISTALTSYLYDYFFYQENHDAQNETFFEKHRKIEYRRKGQWKKFKL